jgi:hypothetical protein
MKEVSSLQVIGLIAVTATAACSGGDDSSSPSPAADSGAADAATDSGAVDTAGDSGAADAAPLSPDCQSLYTCCVGPATQSPQFCTGLVAGGGCGTWLQSYAQAGIQCK